MTDDRIKQFEIRHERLKTLSDEELKAHFWDLCYQVVDPIIELARHPPSRFARQRCWSCFTAPERKDGRGCQSCWRRHSRGQRSPEWPF